MMSLRGGGGGGGGDRFSMSRNVTWGIKAGGSTSRVKTAWPCLGKLSAQEYARMCCSFIC